MKYIGIIAVAATAAFGAVLLAKPENRAALSAGASRLLRRPKEDLAS